MAQVPKTDIIENPDVQIDGDVNPLSEYLGEIAQSISSPIRGRGGTTISPDMYAPTIGKQDVAVGQMSGPLGSMTIFSPGAPIFPTWLLDMSDQQRRADEAAQQQAAIKEMTEWDKIKPFALKGKHAEWTGEVQDFANAYFDYHMEDVKSTFGLTPEGRVELNKRLRQMKPKLDILVSGMDTTYDIARSILEDDDPNKDFYVSEYAISKAQEVLNFNFEDVVEKYGGDFEKAFQELFRDVQDLHKVTGMSIASQGVVDAVNNSVLQGDFKFTRYTTRAALLEASKEGGVNIFLNEKGNINDDLRGMIESSYVSAYGNISEKLRPEYSKYENDVLSRLKSVSEKATQTMSQFHHASEIEYQRKLFEMRQQGRLRPPVVQQVQSQHGSRTVQRDEVGASTPFVVAVDRNTRITYLESGRQIKWSDKMAGGGEEGLYGGAVSIVGYTSMKNEQGVWQRFAMGYALKPDATTQNMSMSFGETDGDTSERTNVSYTTADQNQYADNKIILIPLNAEIASQGEKLGMKDKVDMSFLGQSLTGGRVQNVKNGNVVPGTEKSSNHKFSNTELIQRSVNFKVQQGNKIITMSVPIDEVDEFERENKDIIIR